MLLPFVLHTTIDYKKKSKSNFIIVFYFIILMNIVNYYQIDVKMLKFKFLQLMKSKINK